MKVRIIATPATIAELTPGDLWSFAGPEYWDHAPDQTGGLVQRKCPVYIRNNLEAPKYMLKYPVYRIAIERT